MAREFVGLIGEHEAVPAGTRFGERTVIAETTRAPSGGRRFSVRCSCGAVSRTTLTQLKRLATSKTGGRCGKCAPKWAAAQRARKKADDGTQTKKESDDT
jgi:hypothetical protein